MTFVDSKLVLGRLLEIEEEHQVKVIHVVEAGSRAWGYAGKNSDIDIRFIYVQLPWARKLDHSLDTIRVTDKDLNLDMLGFELRKCCQKITSSDMTMFETLLTTSVYASHPQFAQVIGLLSQYENTNTLFYSARDQAKRHLNLAQCYKGDDHKPAKALLLTMRFSLIAKALNDQRRFALDLPKLCALYELEYPSLKEGFEYLNNNRGLTRAELELTPAFDLAIALFADVERKRWESPDKRNRDLAEANLVYGRMCKLALKGAISEDPRLWSVQWNL
jgi:predicted nucleotidyltransferase